MTAPSPRQLEVLRTIQANRLARDCAPTIRELCDLLGIRSTNGVADHLLALERKGLISRERQSARTLRLTPAGLRAVG